MTIKNEVKNKPASESKNRITDKTSRTLKLLSECNDALLRIADESELLHSVCRLIVEIGGYSFTWVGYARHDKEKKIEPVASCGFDDSYVDYIRQ